MNYTLLGAVAVLIWGFSIPAARIVQEQIGPVLYLGIVFLAVGILSFARQRFSFSLNASERSHPVLYLRWAFFVVHEALLMISVGIVSLPNMPIVILINYLWPTAIIICSILLAGVRVYRLIPFMVGTIIVCTSLAGELLVAHHGESIFSNPLDNLAYGLTLVGAVSWGLYSALSKRYGAVTGEARPMPLFQMTLGLVLPFALFPSFRFPWNLNLTGGFILCAICLAQTFAYYAWDTGMRLGNIVILSLLADFIPWLSLLATALILGIKIEKHTLFSAIFLVAGAMITRLATRIPSAKKVLL